MMISGDELQERTSALVPLRPAGPVALLTIRGGADVLTREGLIVACHGLRRNSDVRSVVVEVDSACSLCNPADLLEPLLLLNRAKPVFAFIECAVGASFMAALPARAIVAHPQATVGKLALRVPGLSDPMIDERLESFNEELIQTVCQYRPCVEHRIVRRLLDHEISGGEVLEHFGLCDFVMPLQRLLAALGGKR